MGFLYLIVQGIFYSIDGGWCSTYFLSVGTVVFGSGVGLLQISFCELSYTAAIRPTETC